MERDKCPQCGKVLRRLYYQAGAGRRTFKGCGWGCFNCGHVGMIKKARKGWKLPLTTRRASRPKKRPKE